MKKIKVWGMLLCLLLCFSISVSAEGTGKSYVYDHSQNAMKVPDPYTVERVLDKGNYSWTRPVDVQSRNGYLYVLDATGEIYILDDTTFEQTQRISFTKAGQPYAVEELKSFWIDSDGTFLVADRSKKMVFRVQADGTVIQEYGKPRTDLIDETADYLPIQVLTDSLGNVYIMSENQYRGIFKLTRNGDFITFYGSKSVDVTAELLLDMMWRNFMTDAMISNSQRYLPTEYNSMVIDSDGFVYATSAASSNMDEWVVKLNSLGNNVLQGPGQFGDFNLGAVYGHWYKTNLCSVAVDDEGYITVLDNTWNRLFQYSQEGELLYVFGGKGDQEGTFESPTCVRAMRNRLMVCDPTYATVTIWTLTEFGATVRKADGLYQAGLFVESAEEWKKVLQQCQNYEYAYVGLGKAEYIQKKYTEAMRYFRLGYAKDEYSMAFNRYRANLLRNAFVPIVLSLFAFVAVLIILRKVLRRYRKSVVATDSMIKKQIRYIGHVLIHPIDGFREMRYNHMGNAKLASVIFALYFLISCIGYTGRGFIFNDHEPSDFNIWVILATTIGLAGSFCLINWLLAVFFDGKGRFKDVWITLGYAMVPSLIALTSELILSKVLTADEGMFLGYITTIGMLWSGAVFVLGLKEIHQYSFSRNLLSLLVSVVGILILLFLLFLMMSLFVQAADFVEKIVEEIMYRVRVGF